MADSKISDLAALTSLATGDLMPVVDVSDTSMAASGTDKKVTLETLRSFFGAYVLAQSAVAASHTGTTSETTLATITVPANALGANGRVRITAVWSYTNSANTKTMRVRFAGTAYGNPSATTSGVFKMQQEIANRNSASSQVAGPLAGAGAHGWGTSTGSLVTSSHDTTSAQDITLTAQLASAGETLTLEHYIVELIP